MSKPRHLLLSILAVIAFATTAKPATVFNVALTGAQEVPPNSSPATGQGLFVLNDAQTELSFDITYSGLIGGPVSGAHFHNAPFGVNGGIVRGVDAAGLVSPDGEITGVWTATDAQPLTPFLVGELLANRIYFNIHTNDDTEPNFPGGEIRGQLVIPEPSSAILLLSALGAAFLYSHRQRR